MKNYFVVVLGCIIMLLSLLGCDNGIPVPGPEPTIVIIEGNLEVAEDFYIRNKPEPVVVNYTVKLVDESQAADPMLVSVRIDLFRFDAATEALVFEQTLQEFSETVECNEVYDGSTSWVYDRQADATTYKIILEATMDGYDETFSVSSDLFVIWKSPGAPKGHAKRDLKKMDQVEKLITRLEGYHEVYEAARQNGYIVGDELVVIHEEMMTVDEAVAMAEALKLTAIENSDQAMEYFDMQDYQTCFTLAKKAARELHQALTIYHALVAQAKDAME
jgi:hypothetical protein